MTDNPDSTPGHDQRSSVNDALEQMSIGSNEASLYSAAESHGLGDIDDPILENESDLELDNLSDMPDENATAISPYLPSPPLDTQYTNPREPAGGAID